MQEMWLPEAVVVRNVAVLVVSVACFDTLGNDFPTAVFSKVALEVYTVCFVNVIVAVASFVGKVKRELVNVLFSDAIVDGVEFVEFGEVGFNIGKLIFALAVDVCWGVTTAVDVVMFIFSWIVFEDVGTEVVTGEFGLVTFECAVVNLVDASLDRVDFDAVDVSFDVSVEALDVAASVVLDAMEIGNFGELTFEVKYVDLGVFSLDEDIVFWVDVVPRVAMVDFCEVADVNLVDLSLENDGLDMDVV